MSAPTVDVVWTLLGIALIGLALRDIFDVLFHPLGRGLVARRIILVVSAATTRFGARRTGALLAGSFSYVAVVATWTALLALGWAFVFLPQMPDGFIYETALDPAANAGFADALYVSLINLTSLGYGDIVPEASFLRILCPVETVFGLGLVTASISWLIAIYNSISRRDSLAHEVHLAKQAEERLGERLVDTDPALLEAMLASFSTQLIRVRRDLIHFPITHYFRSEDDERELRALLPFLRDLAAEAGDGDRPQSLRVRARVLGMAIDDFATTAGDLSG